MLRKIALIFEKASSIGENSGEWGAKNKMLAPTLSMSLRISLYSCGPGEVVHDHHLPILESG